jgi:hypothetical protein
VTGNDEAGAAGPPAYPPRVVLLIAARNPTAPRTGRISVLETAVRGLRSTGAQVVVAALTPEAGPDVWQGAEVVRIPTMSLARTVMAVGRSLLSTRTLNEAVFDSPRIRREVVALAQSRGADLVVCDTIRTTAIAAATGLPVIAHLDDLLSDRYASQAFADGNDSVLGYYGSTLPRPARAGMDRIARRLLGLESARARRREAVIARSVAVAALTGADEARTLAARAGVEVLALPMSVDPAAPGDPASAPGEDAAFLGVLHYGPNRAALKHLRDEILPRLRSRGVTLRVHVIGHYEDDQRAEYPEPDFVFHGYVEDLQEALRRNRMFLSPILSGTGVKTKVLDAMSVGLPVVATSLGVAGIPVTQGVDALIADDPDTYADHIAELVRSPERAAEIGGRGRELLAASMAGETVQAAWRAAAATALGKGAS